jgi:hypothetical protein
MVRGFCRMLLIKWDLCDLYQASRTSGRASPCYTLTLPKSYSRVSTLNVDIRLSNTSIDREFPVNKQWVCWAELERVDFHLGKWVL